MMRETVAVSVFEELTFHDGRHHKRTPGSVHGVRQWSVLDRQT